MIDDTVSAWRRTIRSRVVVAAAIFAAWVVVIEARLVQLQVFEHNEMQTRAEKQRSRTVDVPAMRGEILDRDGNVLARSVDGNAIYAVPPEIKDVDATVLALCDAFGDCTAAERDRLGKRLRQRSPFKYVRRASELSPAAVARVAALKLKGIGFMKEPRRFYPNQMLAAHLLGYVGTDNGGLSGVEEAYDKTIRGRNGSVLIEIDANGRPFASIGQPPTPGDTLQLTINQFLQFVAESELRRGVEENHAQGGSVVIMDPYTGEILALANWPTFNPNTWSDADEIERRNRAIQDVYEPGSTFKVVTASAAIQEHVMSPDDMIDVGRGAISIGSRVVHDTHRYGVLSFTDVLVKSSNVGAIKVGLKLGPERLGRYVRAFGFGTRVAPDFRGESAGLLWNPATWNDSVTASVAMGYQVGVTPIQMATAVSTVANGGELVRPHIVRARITADGRRTEVQPRPLRRVILPGTADSLTTIMEQVVERGTATAAQIDGFTIAGKTGTAAKLIDHHYSKSDYNASFVGFIPSRKPALTILVVIDSPHGHGYYGGTVSAPVFKRIAEKAMQHLGIAPNLKQAPPVLLAARDGQPPAPVRTSTPQNPSVGIVPAVAAASQAGVVPSVVGLSAREAIRALARVGMTARINGDGLVLQQEPVAGSPLDRGTVCSLALGRVVPAVSGSSDQRQ